MLTHDVIIIGGGPAGLAAALVLGRCRRDVLVIDSGAPRNARSRGVHNYLTRDGIIPARFLLASRTEARKYGVKFIDAVVTHAQPSKSGFIIRFGTQERSARRLLLATGVRDELPSIQNFQRFYGTSVHHCPYCDGWEHRDQRLAAYGKGDAAVGLALALRTWSEHVTACCDGTKPSRKMALLAKENSIPIEAGRVVALEGKTLLRKLRFQSGRTIPLDALFFNTGQTQRSDLPRLLGCTFRDDGGAKTSSSQCTTIPGLFLAGDADKDVQFVAVAAGEGATAAVAINRELQDEDRGVVTSRSPAKSKSMHPRPRPRRTPS